METEEIAFEFRKQRYIYDAETNTFEKLKFPVQVTSEDSMSTSIYLDVPAFNPFHCNLGLTCCGCGCHTVY